MSAIATEVATAPAPVVIGAPSAWQRATRSGGLAVGVVLVVVMVLVALLAPWISPYDPDEQNVLMKLEPPSWEYLFGTDAFGRDVLSRVIWGARVSLFVGSVATLAGILIGTVIGIISGYYGGIVDKLITAATDVLLSFPQLIMVAYVTRVTRSGMLKALSEDYVRTARAKGLPSRLVVWRHALRNVLIPVVTVIGLYLGVLIGNAVLTEIVFNRPGLGKLIVSALNQRDYALLQGLMVVTALAIVVANILTDLTYGLVDPRVKTA